MVLLAEIFEFLLAIVFCFLLWLIVLSVIIINFYLALTFYNLLVLKALLAILLYHLFIITALSIVAINFWSTFLFTLNYFTGFISNFKVLLNNLVSFELSTIFFCIGLARFFIILYKSIFEL